MVINLIKTCEKKQMIEYVKGEKQTNKSDIDKTEIN